MDVDADLQAKVFLYHDGKHLSKQEFEAQNVSSQSETISMATCGDTDAQYVLSKWMKLQQTNGSVYLQGEALPAELTRQLSSPGKYFCVAGRLQVVPKVLADGPCLHLQFYIPKDRAAQHVQLDEATQRHGQMALHRPLNCDVCMVCLEALEADKYLMESPSPLRPVIN